MFLASILIYLGKGEFLIAGVNMMNKEDKEKIDTERLGKYLGKMSFIISIGLLLTFIQKFYYNSNLFLIIGLCLTIIPIPMVLIKTFNFKNYLN